MRLLPAFAAVLVLSACGGVHGYRDSNAAVDANPLCASRSDRPGEPVSRDCERVREGTWSSKPPPRPVDLRGGRDRDDR